MSEQFKASSESMNNAENLNLSDKIWNFAEKNKLSLESIHTLKKLFQNEITQGQLSELSLSKLKENIQSSLNNKDKIIFSEISDDNFSKFANEVFALRELIANETNSLKNDVEWNAFSEIVSNWQTIDAEVILSTARCNNARFQTKDPLTHHTDWCLVWTTQSVITVWKITWEVCIDIIKTPYHAYKLITDENYTTNAFKNI